MSTIDILYLSGIIGAFVVFAVVLAGVQYRTRHFDAAKLSGGKGGQETKKPTAKTTVSARWPNAA